MKLQLLVPQYKEPDGIVKSLLDSLAIQQGIDMNEIGVIICNDGSDVFLSEDFLNSYPFQIEYHKEPHRGVSGTRNACLRYAVSDYVMFCDADDMFFNACGLWLMFNEMDIGFDSMVSAFLEETRIDGAPAYVVRDENDQVYVHGKIYRRAFLLEKNIWFDERLEIHEDSYFNTLCMLLSNVPKNCKTTFYLWKWRPDSVCRRDPEYDLKTYQNLTDNRDALITQLLERNEHEYATGFVASHTFDAYYTMNKPAWLDPENREYREKTEKHFSEWFKKYEPLWNEIPIERKMSINDAIRSRHISEGMGLESFTIYDWLNYIKSIQT